MALTATVTGGAVQLTGNPVIVNCSGASTPSGASEYMILLRTISQDGKLPGSPFEDSKTPDGSGNAAFDISGILDQPLEVSFQYPAVAKYIEHPNRPFNIQVQVGERYIDQANLLVENWLGISEVFQLLKGGNSPRQNAMMTAENKNFYSTYIQGKKFLTTRSQSDLIHPTQPIKLWYMVETNFTAYFKIKGYYDDETDTTVSSQISLNTNSLYELNCNPALHGLPFQPAYNKKLKYFDVWLENYGTPQSDVRRFEVDLNHCERPHFLFFANSLGGIDDVYFSGFAIDSFEIEKSLSYRPVRTGDTVYTPTVLASNKTGFNKWAINSGWRSIPTIQFYRDLMLSKQAWFLYPNISVTNSIIVPIIIDNSGGELFNRQNDQHDINIEFIEAHISRFSFDNRNY